MVLLSDPEEGSYLVSPGPGLFLKPLSDSGEYFPSYQ